MDYVASFNEAEIGLLLDLLLEDFLSGGRSYEVVGERVRTDTEAMLGKLTSLRVGRVSW